MMIYGKQQASHRPDTGGTAGTIAPKVPNATGVGSSDGIIFVLDDLSELGCSGGSFDGSNDIKYVDQFKY